MQQSTSTHISNHIREWRRRHRLIKFEILDHLLTEWFTKSFIPPIAKEIAMGGCVTKEQAIVHAQYLDLTYSQSDTLYEFLRGAQWASTSPASSAPKDTPPIDGIIRYMSQQSCSASTSSTKYKSNRATATYNNIDNPMNHSKALEVNVVQSIAVDKSLKCEKGKGKAKQDNPKRDSKKPSVDDTPKRKPKYPCLICDEDHCTQNCPRSVEVSHILKGTTRKSTVRFA